MLEKDKDAIAAEVLGSCMGPNELTELGISFGLHDLNMDDIDLQVGIIVEEKGVWRCDTCDWWVEEFHLHNDICNDCYAACNDE